MGLTIPDYSDALDGDILMIYQDPEPQEAQNTALAIYQEGRGTGQLGTMTGGTWTLTIDGEETTPLEWNADVEAISAAIDALGVAPPGAIYCNQYLIDVANIWFEGPYAGTLVDSAIMTADGAGLTGPDEPYTLSVAVAASGAPEVVGGEKVLRWGKPWQEFPFGGD